MTAQVALIESTEGTITCVVFGEELKQLDEVNVADVGQRLVEIASQLARPQLVLDMTATEFFGSSFIEVLFRVWKKLSAKPAAKLGLAGLQPYCREVLSVTHLDSLWPVFETREAAVEAMNDVAAAG